MIKSLETFKEGGYLPLKSPRGRQLDTRGLEKVEIHSMRNVQTKLMKTWESIWTQSNADLKVYNKYLLNNRPYPKNNTEERK